MPLTSIHVPARPWVGPLIMRPDYNVINLSLFQPATMSVSAFNLDLYSLMTLLNVLKVHSA